MLASKRIVPNVSGSVPPATPITMTEPPAATALTSSWSVASLPTQSSTSVGASAAGELGDLRGRVLAGLDVAVAPSSLREGELRRVDVDGDHAGWR